MQSAKFTDLIDSRTEEEMVSIAQQNLDAEVFQEILRNSFYCRQRAYWHEDGSLDLAVRRDQASSAGAFWRVFNLEFQRH